jgi:hypothetical protein
VSDNRLGPSHALTKRWELLLQIGKQVCGGRGSILSTLNQMQSPHATRLPPLTSDPNFPSLGLYMPVHATQPHKKIKHFPWTWGGKELATSNLLITSWLRPLSTLSQATAKLGTYQPPSDERASSSVRIEETAQLEIKNRLQRYNFSADKTLSGFCCPQTKGEILKLCLKLYYQTQPAWVSHILCIPPKLSSTHWRLFCSLVIKPSPLVCTDTLCFWHASDLKYHFLSFLLLEF